MALKSAQDPMITAFTSTLNKEPASLQDQDAFRCGPHNVKRGAQEDKMLNPL